MLARPTSVLIGAEGCGAEELGKWLARHPAVAMPAHPVHHFSHLYRGVAASALSHAALRGYHEMLVGNETASNASIMLEISPSYLEMHWFPELPRLLAAYAPDVKLLAVVCDPAERALRQFKEDEKLARSGSSCSGGSASDPLQPVWHERARELRRNLADDGVKDFGSLAAAVAAVDASPDRRPQLLRRCRSRSCHYQKYFLPGLYQQQLTQVLREFRREQLLVVDGGTLARGGDEARASVDTVLEFLDLNPREFPNEDLQWTSHRTATSMSEERGLLQLRRLYREANALLACSIQAGFPLSWSPAVATSLAKHAVITKDEQWPLGRLMHRCSAW